ncbi:MAG: PorV/PorQ family protein [Elusimicrobia bacterium]|nr:PorV/PorQ family protein [Elusimicrobiota bacterium]
MKLNRWKILLLYLLPTTFYFLPAYALGSRNDVGTSGAQFLKLGVGARPAGMGEAYSAVADDIFTTYYNPAGLAEFTRPQVGGMHNQYFQSIRHEFASFAVPLREGQRGTLAVSIYNLGISDIERRGTTETDTPSETFDSSDLAYALSYGLKLNDRLSLGTTLKYIDQTLDGVHATALGADVGSLYRWETSSVALGVRNLGSKTKFHVDSSPLPMVLFAGLSQRLSSNLLFAADLNIPRDNRIGFGAGTEFNHSFFEGLSAALRAGYNSRNSDPGGLSGISIGAGMTYQQLGFDFAWVPFGDLGNTFRYSLLLKF